MSTDSALYAAATGMETRQVELNVISNNIANSTTPGFKKSRPDTADLFYQHLKPAGSDTGDGSQTPAGIDIGGGTHVTSTSKIFTQGNLKSTGGKLDIAIDGEGFLEVLSADGTSAYTRAGNLKLVGDQVVTAEGYVVQNNFQSIPSNHLGIAIAKNGTVTVALPGNTTSTFRINLVRFGNPQGLQSIGSNLYLQTGSSGEPETGSPQEDGFGSIIQGHIESSNVNPIEEMVQLIVTQHAFSLNSKSIQVGEDMKSETARLKR